MLSNLEVMMEMGIIMLFAFIGAALASRFKQSVIIGYIIVGVLIGPYMNLDILGVHYDGLVHDITFIEYLSQLGLVLLLFFLGLEFSFTKLRKTKGPAALLALVNTGIDLFMGIILGMALGWPLVDTLFLAGVVAMGSAAITGKTLMEMKKFSSPETEFLLGMIVVEDFVSMIVLAIMGGLMVQSGGVGLGAESLAGMLVGVLAFYGFFVFLAVWAIPRTVKYMSNIKSDELFVLFGLGMVFLSSALAEAAGVPAIIGAFFLGMVFAETKLVAKLDDRLSPLRDVFVAMFFVLFGMLIDPAMFGEVIGIVLVAVPLVLLSDLIMTAALAYMMGFTGRGAVTMGAALCGRGAESLMYASVGGNTTATTKSSMVFPFAGAFCLILSILAPVLMHFSDAIFRGLSRLLPGSVKLGGTIISRTMGKVLMPAPLRLFQRGRRIEACLVAYFALLMVVILTTGLPHVAAMAGAAAMTWYLYRVMWQDLRSAVRQTSYESIGIARGDGSQIAKFTAGVIALGLLTILLVAFLIQYAWWLPVSALVAYPLVVVLMSRGFGPQRIPRSAFPVNGRGRP
ncbi:MAG: cation:proton antiporter [Methanomassiliicoccales archaeon]|nr:cation:proton antiporter [Methanomassiliicoccales archaeon]